MKNIRTTQSEYDALYELQVRNRRDCDAAFSANEKGETWLFITNSQTPKNKRIYVHGESSLLDHVADFYTALPDREIGGRFQFRPDGAYLWKNGGASWTKFVNFPEVLVSPKPEVRQSPGSPTQGVAGFGPSTLTYAELRARQTQKRRHA